MMFERGIRGGITHIAKRYAEANNKYMTNFDSSKPSTYIQYLDANNLYAGQCHNHFLHMSLNG